MHGRHQNGLNWIGMVDPPPTCIRSWIGKVNPALRTPHCASRTIHGKWQELKTDMNDATLCCDALEMQGPSSFDWFSSSFDWFPSSFDWFSSSFDWFPRRSRWRMWCREIQETLLQHCFRKMNILPSKRRAHGLGWDSQETYHVHLVVFCLFEHLEPKQLHVVPSTAFLVSLQRRISVLMVQAKAAVM